MENTLRCNRSGTLTLWAEGCNLIGDSVHCMTTRKHLCPTADNLLCKGETEQTVPKCSWPADQMVISRPFSLNLARIWAHFFCENCFYKKDVLYSNLLARLIPSDHGCFTCRNFYWAQSELGAQLYYKSLVLLRLTKNNRYLWVCLWSSISLSAALFVHRVKFPTDK